MTISQTDDLLGFSHTTISRVYWEWSEKEKISSERQLCGWKCLVDVRGQRRMDRLVRDDRKATVTQITTRYNQDLQNTISEHTTHRTLKQMGSICVTCGYMWFVICVYITFLILWSYCPPVPYFTMRNLVSQAVEELKWCINSHIHPSFWCYRLTDTVYMTPELMRHLRKCVCLCFSASACVHRCVCVQVCCSDN